MSTKLYYGLKSNKTIIDIIEELKIFREKYIFSGRFSFLDSKKLYSDKGYEFMELMKKNGNGESVIQLFPFRDYTLAYPCLDEYFLLGAAVEKIKGFEQCLDLLKKETSFYEYGYWDNVDQDESVSDEEWDERCKSWSFIEYKPLKYYGVGFLLSSETDFVKYRLQNNEN